MSSPNIYSLQIILQRAQALRGANLGLKPQLQPLDAHPVPHPRQERSGVGVGDLGNVAVERKTVGQRRHVGPERPVLRLLPLPAQEPVVEQPGALGVPRVPEDPGRLGPRDKVGPRRVRRGEGRPAAGRGEADGLRVVGRGGDGRRRRGAADPSGLLGEQGVEPGDAFLLHSSKTGRGGIW